jgi:hypothetical protein
MRRICEQSASGIRGFLLYSPIDGHLFRVYDKDNSSTFQDYTITAQDIEIQLLSDFNALVLHDDGTKTLDYSSKVLGRTYKCQNTKNRS